MQKNLGISINPLVKLVVGNLGILNANFMRHHKAWLGLASDDEVAQISVVSLYIALAGAKSKTLR